MKQLLEVLEKLRILLKPTYIGFLLALVAFLFALNFLTKTRELNNQLSGLSQELLDRKSEVDRLQAELAQANDKTKNLETQVTAGAEKSAQDQAKIEGLEAISKKYSEILGVLESPKLRVIPLITSDPESKAHGKFLWIPGLKTASVLVTGLNSNADSSEYQLWMVQQGAVNLNLMSFTVEPAESKVFKLAELPITDPKKLSSILITREPKGGSSRPSGTRVLSGKL